MFYCNLFSSHERAGDDAVLTEKKDEDDDIEACPTLYYHSLVLYTCLRKAQRYRKYTKEMGKCFFLTDAFQNGSVSLSLRRLVLKIVNPCAFVRCCG